MMRLITFVYLASFCTSVHAGDRPNILWLTIEDISPEWGCYGDRYATTPVIDQLATRSIRYTRAFAEAPMCAPSRSALITGMHTGPLGTSQMRSQHPIPSNFRGFPALLREAGYYTCNNVKTDYNLGGEKAMIRDAWDESSGDAHWRKRPKDKPFFTVINYMDTHQSRASRDDYAVFQKNVQSRLKPEEIHDPALAPLPPHYPDTPFARRTVARYHDCITALDHFVAEKLAELEEDGLVEDTIVFLFSDHGAGMPTGKALALEYGLRVPMLVHFPTKFRHLAPSDPGTVTDRIVSFVDFAPTVLHLAGVNLPEHMHGKPFLGTEPAEPRRYAHGTRDRLDETLETTRWITDGRFHLVRRFASHQVLDQQSLTSFYNGNGEFCQEIRALAAAGTLTDDSRHYWETLHPAVMLFDTSADPWCRHNLADQAEHAAKRDELLAQLDVTMRENLDLGFWPEPERVAAESGRSAYERAREPGLYPLERILATANLAGMGTEHRSELENALQNDPDPSVRYWAVMGLAGIRPLNDTTRTLLRTALKDPAPSVRIVAAETLASSDNPDFTAKALSLLVDELDSRNPWAACRAARSLELLGERSRPHVEAMKRTLKSRSSGFVDRKPGPDSVNYSLEFSLRTAIEKLQ